VAAILGDEVGPEPTHDQPLQDRQLVPELTRRWGQNSSAKPAGGFGRAPADHDWKAQAERHGLGWVCARRSAGLAGFVNVAWDGGGHAFILATVVAGPLRRHGIGTGLVRVAAREASAAGCEWLHVDFEDHLSPFYFGGCGFRPTNAGLIRLGTPA
jgi:GNAT superfamily N-acetyltransferase